MLISYEGLYNIDSLNNVIFAGDKVALIISDIASSDPIDVAITVEGNPSTARFHLTPILVELPASYALRINVDEVIKALVPEVQISLTTSSILTCRSLSGISVIASNDSGEQCELNGYYLSRGSRNVGSRSWLTMRDVVSDTFRGASERLSAMYVEKNNSATLKLWADVWFDSQPPVTTQLTSYVLSDSPVIIDAVFTLSDIEALPEVAAVMEKGAEIAAYDIGINEKASSSGSISPQVLKYIVRPRRFIVRRYDPRYREFLFVNRFGVADRVIAYGSIERTLSGESGSFINSGIEKEVSGNIRETFSVSSGRLRTAREVATWLDFLESTQRYIFEDGGIKRIVIESYQTDLKTGASGKVSFAYRLSEASDLSVALDETPLEDYDYSTTSQNKGSALLGYGITSSIEP